MDACGIMTAKLILHVLLLRAVYREKHDVLKPSNNSREEARSMNREAGGGKGDQCKQEKEKESERDRLQRRTG